MSTLDPNFIPQEEAMELKKLGFDKPLLGYAPLYQQAFEWFEENYLLSPRYFSRSWEKDKPVRWTGAIETLAWRTVIDIEDDRQDDPYEEKVEASLAILKRMIFLANNSDYQTKRLKNKTRITPA